MHHYRDVNNTDLKRGFTLIEILVVLAILSILAGVKLEREDDSATNNEFTSNRQAYLKFVYDFGRGFGVDELLY